MMKYVQLVYVIKLTALDCDFFSLYILEVDVIKLTALDCDFFSLYILEVDVLAHYYILILRISE